MRTFNVTVNGVPYEVSVDEVNGATQPVVAAPVQQVTSAPKASAPVAKKEAPAQLAEGEKISAPMPGTILNVKVSVGDKVKKGDVLLVLEAMKMENEISAPIDGEVVQVSVLKGASVNSGDPMIVIA